MIFANHSELEGTHAFLSPSNNAWVNYTEEKLVQRYMAAEAVRRGTELHDYARRAIELRRQQPRNKDSLNLYVNDAIGYGMTPEQPLFYSYNCYGTADAICYKKNVLRIHDLKTGETEAHFKQLYIYAALFCLEYGREVNKLRKNGKDDIDIAAAFGIRTTELHFEPEKMDDIVLRIYQYNEYREEHPEPGDIRELMDIIVVDNQVIQNLKAEV